MNVFDRREFLNRAAILSAAAAGGVSVAPAAAAPQRSANEKLRVAVVGVRGRGMSHVSGADQRTFSTAEYVRSLHYDFVADDSVCCRFD